MTDSKPNSTPESSYLWKNPLTAWGTATANAEAPSISVPDPATVWRESTTFKVQTYLVGRLKYFIVWPTHRKATWDRLRWWPTRRNILNIRAHYNPKTDVSEKKILDRKPIYWLFALVALLLGPLIFPDNQMNALMTAGATFGGLRHLAAVSQIRGSLVCPAAHRRCSWPVVWRVDCSTRAAP